MSGNNSRPGRGFTLLEVMISMAILSVGILGLVGMQITAMRANRQGSKMSQALFLAESKADLLLAYNFADPLLLDSNTGNDPGAGAAFPMLAPTVVDPTSQADGVDPFTLDQYGNPTATTIAVGSSGFQRFWQIADEEANAELPGPDVKRINVVVRFMDSELSYGFHQVNVTVIKPWSM